MIQNAATSSNIETRLKDHYSAIEKRLRGLPVRKRAMEVVTLPVVDVARPEPCMWQRENIAFDAHVIDFHDWFSSAISPTRRYIGRRAAELGFTYAEIIGPRRHIPLVAARQLLIWEVRTKFGKGYLELGRLFGGRDHTTCVWAVKKIEAERAIERAAGI